MMATKEKTVGEIAREYPAAARVLEQYGIDFCCGGNRLIEEVCSEKGISVEKLISDLETSTAPRSASAVDWNTARLGTLIDHIVATHHEYLRTALPRLEAMLEKVIAAHGDRHADSLKPLAENFSEVKAELDSHMPKEEMVLFPYIVRLEAASLVGAPAPPAPFGSIANPIRMMEMEHASAGRGLAEMRRVTSDYTPPEDACNTYRAMLHEMAELEADLHVHIQLENNILFPRAMKM